MKRRGHQREIIDIHTHCFTGRHLAAEVIGKLRGLRRLGVRHLVSIGVVNTTLSAKDAWSIVAGVPEHRGDPDLREAEHLLPLVAATGSSLLPFLDTRLLAGNVDEYLEDRLAEGFRGLKGIYLPDGDNDIGAVSVPEVFGLTLEEYRRREWEIFAFAETHDLPVIYHIDARRHGEVIAAILQDFPGVRIDFAHFGISRRAFVPFLERHSNAFTDFSSILPHMRRDPKGYREFMLTHQEHVCFGSDAFLFTLEKVAEYIAFVDKLALPEEVEEKILSRNPRRFLGSALVHAGGGREAEPPS